MTVHTKYFILILCTESERVLAAILEAISVSIADKEFGKVLNIKKKKERK